VNESLPECGAWISKLAKRWNGWRAGSSRLCTRTVGRLATLTEGVFVTATLPEIAGSGPWIVVGTGFAAVLATITSLTASAMTRPVPPRLIRTARTTRTMATSVWRVGFCMRSISPGGMGGHATVAVSVATTYLGRVAQLESARVTSIPIVIAVIAAYFAGMSWIAGRPLARAPPRGIRGRPRHAGLAGFSIAGTPSA
jgi:hypothetical protein